MGNLPRGAVAAVGNLPREAVAVEGIPRRRAAAAAVTQTLRREAVGARTRLGVEEAAA